MKVLHTSDWHLGQKLLQLDRHAEFVMALDWLLKTVESEAVDVLLVAGDIFDIGNPPNQARQLYYNFLRRLLASTCRHIVITGGNHDSPAMLNAPRELLQAFNIHVLGAATDNLTDELVVLRNEQGEPEMVVAAVPFLRDRDLRISRAGENQQERTERLQQGLADHYQQLAELARPWEDKNIPIIAMGHLYAKGAVAADKQDNIYVGNRENMEAGQFPGLFSYVALGHIHRAQKIGGTEHIRYAGSLVPLSFSETKDEKLVHIVHFTGAAVTQIEALAVPTFRRLKTIQGDLERVQASLERFAARDQEELTPWVEVIIDTQSYQPQLDQLLRDFVADMRLELVKIRINRPFESLTTSVADTPDLEYLEVEEVFQKKCASQGDLDEKQLAELTLTFRELQSWMIERTAP
jgi:DNA repair protein SbcD/Mre11